MAAVLLSAALGSTPVYCGAQSNGCLIHLNKCQVVATGTTLLDDS